eukprot:sb/3477432/
MLLFESRLSGNGQARTSSFLLEMMDNVIMIAQLDERRAAHGSNCPGLHYNQTVKSYHCIHNPYRKRGRCNCMNLFRIITALASAKVAPSIPRIGPPPPNGPLAHSVYI